MHKLGRTLRQRWGFEQATASFFVHLASAFDSVDKLSLEDRGCGLESRLAYKAHKSILRVHQEEGEGRWERLTHGAF